MKIVVTDLDGTLLPGGGKVSHVDISTLRMLGNRKIIRVIATGRSYSAILRNIPRTFPIDYLIFSTGVGIMDWRSGKIIKSTSISSEGIRYIVEHLKRHNLDFMLHNPAPDTHKFYYSPSKSPIGDFFERQRLYSDDCQPLECGHFPVSSQALAFIPNNMDVFSKVTEELTPFKVVRTTSPIDDSNIWIEIFEKNVSKGHALEYLAGQLGVLPSSVMVIGNDYNDIDMLNFTSNSFVVSNAPADLKASYYVVGDASNSAFTEAVNVFLNR